VRQLVDDGEFRSPFEKRIDVHLFDNMTFVFDLFARDYLKPAKLFFGLLPPVRFDQTYHYIDTVAAFGLCCPQHLIGFPDAGSGTQEYLQATALRFTGLKTLVTR
jgi:hypothetical protein